ncbi:hypothetical protein [Falsiroseomonas tokyonensis]|uniref:DUF4815 domain-containing protein n=1 Tax=Falsiroseomonas tokyonensis TaxID=430521 RepID=A0ABV7C3D0_9PROT|nr:hypothetical protein [Falsiroseomonas tokyonensis]MBU8540804.1 hypothetical protein [Falsiroseomonas tokyonensis]
MLDSGIFPYGLYPEASLPAAYEAEQFTALVRLATAAYHSDQADLPASTVWPPRILSGIEIAQDVVGGLGLGGVVALTASEITVADGDNWSADMARYGTADGREIEIRVAEVLDPRASDYGTPLRDTALVWRGPVARVDRLAGRKARVALGDATDRLSALLQSTRYTGTGGLQGSEALKDRPMPVCLGRRFNIQPVYLGIVDIGDGLLPTYQTHWRGIVGHNVVRMRGVTQTKVVSTPGVSEWRDYPALGLFQLGSDPDGTVTCDVSGEASAYPDSIAAVLWHMVSALGPQMTDDDRDSVSWQFAEADLPGLVGFYQPAQDITTLAAVQRILSSCGAVLSGDRGGKLRLFDPFTATTDIQFDIAALNVVQEPEPVPLPDQLAPAPREVKVDWGQNDAPIPDLGTAADATLRQRLADTTAPVASYASNLVTQRVARERALRLPGAYYDLVDAQARAERIGTWLEGGARAVRVMTDRYLGQINLGDYGRVTYPGYGLDTGFAGVVVGLREYVERRRVEIVIVGAGG